MKLAAKAKKPTKRAVRSPRAKPQMVLVRTYSAGVHFGTLVSQNGKEVELSNARRIWRWYGANTLHEISLRGVDVSRSRVSEAVPSIKLTEAIEMLPLADAAVQNLSTAKWTP